MKDKIINILFLIAFIISFLLICVYISFQLVLYVSWIGEFKNTFDDDIILPLISPLISTIKVPVRFLFHFGIIAICQLITGIGLYRKRSYGVVLLVYLAVYSLFDLVTKSFISRSEMWFPFKYYILLLPLFILSVILCLRFFSSSYFEGFKKAKVLQIVFPAIAAVPLFYVVMLKLVLLFSGIDPLIGSNEKHLEYRGGNLPAKGYHQVTTRYVSLIVPKTSTIRKYPPFYRPINLYSKYDQSSLIITIDKDHIYRDLIDNKNLTDYDKHLFFVKNSWDLLALQHKTSMLSLGVHPSEIYRYKNDRYDFIVERVIELYPEYKICMYDKKGNLIANIRFMSEKSFELNTGLLLLLLESCSYSRENSNPKAPAGDLEQYVQNDPYMAQFYFANRFSTNRKGLEAAFLLAKTLSTLYKIEQRYRPSRFHKALLEYILKYDKDNSEAREMYDEIQKVK